MGFGYLVGGGLGFDFAVAKVVVANGVVSGGRRKIHREIERKRLRWIKNNKEMIFRWSVKKYKSFDVEYIIK